ncbi:DEKNAAC103203 [Brettanomyces naardenensis]|uniref:DEKNAAC103203 n=1 Tax=Brettanomyces naardenensis TaxID=13370 RepID=A0A448YMH8_BRENA|nr:DEKNAAC103203 [Brettanomyces naardenensis]
MSSYKPVVAVIGLNGALGRHVLEALTSPTFKSKVASPIIAISRKAPETQRSGVKYVEGSVDDADSLKEAYRGVDVVVDISTTNVSHEASVDVAVANGVKLYIPSEFGSDYSKSEFKDAFAAKAQTVQYAKSKGLKTVEIITGFFTEWFIRGAAFTGLDAQKDTFQLHGDGKTPVSTTSLIDVGKVVASIVVKPVAEIPNVVIVQGSSPTFTDIAAYYETVTGKKLERLTPVSAESSIEAARAVLKKGVTGFGDFAKILLAVVVSGKGGDFTHKNDDDFVNPGQSLWKWVNWKSVADGIWKKQ